MCVCVYFIVVTLVENNFSKFTSSKSVRRQFLKMSFLIVICALRQSDGDARSGAGLRAL